MRNFSGIFIILAILFLALAQILGIGYGLYLWVIVDVVFKMALFKGFIVWASMLAIGGIAYGLAIFTV